MLCIRNVRFELIIFFAAVIQSVLLEFLILYIWSVIYVHGKNMQTVPMINLRKGILPSHLMLLLLCFLIDDKMYYYTISFRYLCCCCCCFIPLREIFGPLPFKWICGCSNLALKSFNYMVPGHHGQCFEDLFGHYVSWLLTFPFQNRNGKLSVSYYFNLIVWKLILYTAYFSSISCLYSFFDTKLF